MNYAADFTHKFIQPGHEINARIQYTRGWEDETYFIHDSSEVRTGSDITNILATEHTTLLSTDYVKPLSSGRLDAGIAWKVFGGRGTVNFSASDILNTFGIRQDIVGEGFTAVYENYYKTQVFRLGLKYRFD